MPGPDVFALLTEDHRRVDQLFERFQQGGDAAVAVEICDELTVHAKVEEELVYPVLSTKVNSGHAQEARREHEDAKRLISQIEAAIEGGGDVASLMSQLQEAVQHHVQEEETEIFPEMREQVPSLVEAMGADVLERKKTLEAELQEARSTGQPARVVEQTPPPAGM